MRAEDSANEKMPPQGVGLSDFIATFALSCHIHDSQAQRQVKIRIWQHPGQLFAAQDIIKNKQKFYGIKEKVE